MDLLALWWIQDQSHALARRQAFSEWILLCPVPLHGILQALFEVDAWFVAEVFFGFRDVGAGVFNVTRAFWPIRRVTIVAGEFFEDPERLVERRRTTCRHVEDATYDRFCRCFRRQQVRLHSVIDVGEVAA